MFKGVGEQTLEQALVIIVGAHWSYSGSFGGPRCLVRLSSNCGYSKGEHKNLQFMFWFKGKLKTKGRMKNPRGGVSTDKDSGGHK